MKNPFTNQKVITVPKNLGFLMVEVLVVVAIITGAVLVAMGVAQKSIYVYRQALHTQQAAFLLEEGAEGVRIIRDNGWDNISSLTFVSDYYLVFDGGTWILSTTSNTAGIFTRKVNVSAVNRDNVTGDISGEGTEDAGSRLITITVSWLEGGTTVTKTLPLYIMDIFS